MSSWETSVTEILDEFDGAETDPNVATAILSHPTPRLLAAGPYLSECESPVDDAKKNLTALIDAAKHPVRTTRIRRNRR